VNQVEGRNKWITLIQNASKEKKPKSYDFERSSTDMKYRNKIVIALISFWALFFGLFAWVASGLSGFGFALTGEGCFACFNPSTFYTPILSWVYIIALAIGISGGLYSSILAMEAIIPWFDNIESQYQAP